MSMFLFIETRYLLKFCEYFFCIPVTLSYYTQILIFECSQCAKFDSIKCRVKCAQNYQRVFCILSENQPIPNWLGSRNTGNNILLSLRTELDRKHPFSFLSEMIKIEMLTWVGHSKIAETWMRIFISGSSLLYIWAEIPDLSESCFFIIMILFLHWVNFLKFKMR